MQLFKRIVDVCVKSVNKNFVRNAAANNAAVNAKEDQVELKPWEEIPGPPSLPILGQMHHFLPGQMLSDAKKMQENLYKYYGPVVRLDGQLGKPPMIFLYDPESCAYILRAENWSPVRPGFESIEYYRKYHNKSKEASKQITGLITDHGDNWRKFRTTVNPVMLHSKTIRLYTSQLEQVAEDMIQRMRSIRDKDNKLTKELDAEMNLWALESIGTVALGGRLNCFDQNLPDDSPEKRLIQCVHDVFIISNELDFKPSLWKYLPTRKFKKAMKVYEDQESLAKYFVRKAQKEILVNKKSDEEKGILEKLLDINENFAIIMASDMLFAGVDTAATTMIATLYLLAKHPDKQDKLRKELSSNESRKYLKACIKESLRVMPVVGGNMRMTTRDYNILGYRIPKNVFVIFVHQHLSIIESQFPKPKEYIPERWIEEGPLYYKNHAHPFACMPFGFGVRMCIGRRIAELEIETFLEKVIQNFQVEWTGPPPEVFSTSLNYIKGPYNFTFKDV